jgi:hypothetical protein
MKSSSLLPLFYSSNSGNTFLTMMPQWTSDNKVPLSEFSTERALGKVKQFRSNHTMLVLKTMIRLPLIYKKRATKVRTANFHTRRLYLTEWGNLVKKYYGSNKWDPNNSKARFAFLTTVPPFLLMAQAMPVQEWQQY